MWVFNALKHCAGRLAEDATPLVASASSTAIPASARTAPAAQTMPAALRGFSFTFHVFGVQHIVGGDYPIRVDCNDFNDPYRNPELHAHPGWHSQTLWNCFRSESWENLLRNLFRWIRDEAAPGQHLFGIFCTTGRYRSVAVAWLLEEVLKQMSADRITVQYLAREAGEWSHLCSNCEDCREDNPAKQELKRALATQLTELWAELMRKWCACHEQASRSGKQPVAQGLKFKGTYERQVASPWSVYSVYNIDMSRN